MRTFVSDYYLGIGFYGYAAPHENKVALNFVTYNDSSVLWRMGKLAIPRMKYLAKYS